MTHIRRLVLVLGLAAIISMGSPNQGKIFYGINSPFYWEVHVVNCFCAKGSVQEIYG